MKVRVDITVELSKEQVRDLVQLAKTTGHGYDKCKAPGRLIRRYLTGRVESAVAYAHEHVNGSDG